MRQNSLATPVVTLLLLGITAVGRAQCIDDADAIDARRSARKAAQCNDRILRAGLTICQTLPSPVCAGTLAIAAIALAYGPNHPPAAQASGSTVSLQRRCQKQIGRGVTDFMKKLVLITRGKSPAEAEATARRSLDKVVDRCAVTVVQHAGGVVLPQVGPQCAAAVGAPGNPVDAVALRDCLLGLMRTWVDRVVPSPQPLRPNILFILSDDQRWDSTDATHSPGGAFIMPRLHAELGDSGIRFTNAYMTTPLCCPSRSSILRGSYAHRTGVYKNGGTNGGADDFDDSSSIATWLQGAGYRTALMGKYLNGYPGLWTDPAPPYVPPGWTEWHGASAVSHFSPVFVEPDGLGGYHEVAYGPTDYFSDLLREKAKTFITDSVNLGEPFFLYLAFKAPHLPQEPATRHEGRFQHFPPWRPPSYNEADVSDKPAWVQALPLQNSAQLDQIRIDQLEMLQAVDEAIGGSTEFGITGIMEHLRTLGVADDTIVVYFADNGWYWGEHRLRAKTNPYDEAIRSPMFVRYPRLAPLKRVDTRFALNIDLAPTFAELAGVGVPIAHDGESLLNVLDGTTPSWRTDFLAEAWPNSHPYALVHEDQWKYTEIADDPGNPLTTFETELYDLIADPYELNNLATLPEHATRIATMATRLRQLRPNWPIDADPNGPDPGEEE